MYDYLKMFIFVDIQMRIASLRVLNRIIVKMFILPHIADENLNDFDIIDKSKYTWFNINVTNAA